MSSSSDVEYLRAELEAARILAAREKARAKTFELEIQQLKEQSLSAHNKLEQEEEFITNNLMKKLEKMNSEKREMLMRVEQEEEFLTNSLQKRLDRVMREKADLEAQMAREKEQASQSGNLEKRLCDMAEERARLVAEKVELERQLEAEQEYIVNKLQKQTMGLAKEKDHLMAEREELRQQVEKLHLDKVRLGQEKVMLENTMEAEEESIVNRLQTQMLELYQRNKYLERRLEAGSKTPSVMSESDTEPLSEDECASGLRGSREGRLMHAYATSPYRHPWGHSGSARGGLSHPPWERDMYMSVTRRKSSGSAVSVGGASASSGRGIPQSTVSGGRGNTGDGRKGDRGRWSGGRSTQGTAGSSSANSPRSSLANTPMTTPRSTRSDSVRGESVSPSRAKGSK